MSDLNKVFLMGRLGADPETRHLSDGTPVASFSVATDQNYKRRDEWKRETTWHRVVAWRHLAELAAKRLHKGARVFVEGSLKTRQWTDHEGRKQSTIEVVARALTPLDRPREESQGPAQAPIEDYVSF